jgi:hypothetical protein
MARRLWVVLVEDFNLLDTGEHYRGQYVQSSHATSDSQVSVFLDKRAADEAAQQMATKNPGKDVHVFSPDYGFTAAPRPVESKVWTPDGKFIPGTPE